MQIRSDTSGACRAGDGPPPPVTGANPDVLCRCHAFAASLATTLMVVIVVFQAGDGTHGAMPADEFDGDEDMVKLELDPWE